MPCAVTSQSFVFAVLLHDLVAKHSPGSAKQALHNGGKNGLCAVLRCGNIGGSQHINSRQNNAHSGQQSRNQLVLYGGAGFQAIADKNQHRNQHQKFRFNVSSIVHNISPF
nr:MAG TPA: hypothetical protein [Caudoviricetes sp.]